MKITNKLKIKITSQLNCVQIDAKPKTIQTLK